MCIAWHYKKVKVSNVNAITQTDRYCEFTAGGDLLVEFPSCLSPLVITESPLVITEGTKEGNNLSPLHKGTSKSSTLSIEGKKRKLPILRTGRPIFCKYDHLISNTLCQAFVIIY